MNSERFGLVSRIFAVAGLTLASSAAVADSVDLNLHDDALRFTYANELSSRLQGTMFDVGILHHEINDDMFHLGFYVSGANWSEQGSFDVKVGGRAVMVDTDSNSNIDLSAIGLGGSVRFSPAPRLGIGGEFYYAPDIIAFEDAESYFEGSVKLDYQLLPQAFVYVGYRRVEFDVKGFGTAELDDDVHVGMTLTF